MYACRSTPTSSTALTAGSVAFGLQATVAVCSLYPQVDADFLNRPDSASIWFTSICRRLLLRLCSQVDADFFNRFDDDADESDMRPTQA